MDKKELYTFKQAYTKLGVTPRRLTQLVSQGKIQRIIPPLSTDGLYDKDQIDSLAGQLEAFRKQYQIAGE